MVVIKQRIIIPVGVQDLELMVHVILPLEKIVTQLAAHMRIFAIYLFHQTKLILNLLNKTSLVMELEERINLE